MFYFNNRGKTRIFEFDSANISMNLDLPFDNLYTKIFGVDLYYFFNHKRYSNSAAYTDSHTYSQHKSAGSLIAGISFTSHDLFFDFSELSNDDRFSALHDLETQNNSYNTYCISFGYGYNFIFSKKWLINLTLIPSIGIKIDKDKSNENEHFTMRNKGKLALIYNLNRCFMGINCQYNSNWYYAKDYSISNSLGTFNLLYGVRF